MKIAVAAESKSEDDLVSSVYGRANFFLIFEDGNMVKVISNPFKMGGGGAGFGVSQMLAKEGVELVVAGKFGGNVVDFLAEKNIERVEINDKSVKEAVKACQDQD